MLTQEQGLVLRHELGIHPELDSNTSRKRRPAAWPDSLVYVGGLHGVHQQLVYIHPSGKRDGG